MAKWFKKREAFEIADRTKNLNKDKKTEFKLSPFKFYDAFGTNVDDKEVMQKWVERRLTVRAENQIITREYMKGKFWNDFLWILLGTILVTFGADYFILATGSTGLIMFGSGAIANFFANLTSWAGGDDHQKAMLLQSTTYFAYLFAINIPLMIFGWIKVGHKFTLLTIMFLAMQIALSEIVAYIPVINPTDWAMMVNSHEIGLIPTSWNGSVWLFLKAIIGGIIVGIGYALVYRGHGSSAGTDFVTMYLSIRKEKSIATINRDVYYAILAVVIILNTVIMKNDQFNPDIKYGQLYGSADSTLWNNIDFYLNKGPDAVNHQGLFSEAGLKNAEAIIANSADTDWLHQTMKTLKDGKTVAISIGGSNVKITPWGYEEFIQELCKSNFTGYTKGQVNLMRFLYIFGPTLFASFALMIISTLVTDYFYPTHKVKTYVIATDKPDEMRDDLTQIGYRNNFIRFEAKNEFQGKVLDRDVIMITMTVTNWREVEPSLLEVDPRMSVNILKTDRVKGYFDYMIRSDRTNEEAFEILKKDKQWMKEIHEASLIETDKQYDKYMAKRNKIIERNTLKVNEDAKTKRELKQWYKAQIIKIKKTKQRELLTLEHNWLLDFAESQKQFDYIKKEYSHKLKELGTPDKKRLHSVKKEYETKKKRLAA